MQIITITAEDIGEFARISETRPTIVRYHSPNCGHCIAMENEWKTLARSGLFEDKNVAIVDVDVSVADKINHPSAKNALSTGVPSIYFLKGNQMEEYKGDRSSKKMEEFVNAYAPGKSRKNNEKSEKIIDSIDSKLKKIGNNYERSRHIRDKIKYRTTPRRLSRKRPKRKRRKTRRDSRVRKSTK
jgi:hypothetical protein